MGNTTIENQIPILEQQIQLQESNYRYAMELKKDSAVLRRMRYNIKALKELLLSLKEYSKKPGTTDGNKATRKSPYLRKRNGG
jgi:hypothetical protein